MCSELLQGSESTGRQQEQRHSPEETGMCVCEGGMGCGWMWMCMYVGGYIVCVFRQVCGEGEGVSVVCGVPYVGA